MKGDVDVWVLQLVSIVGAMILVIYAAGFIANIFTSSCWKTTMNELEPLGKSKLMGLGAALGKEQIKIPITMSGCVDKIAFTDFDGCKSLCRQYPGDRSDCYNACNKCYEKEGCIVALPASGSFGTKFKNFITGGLWREKPDSLISNYAFDGLTLDKDDYKNQIVCVELSLGDNGYGSSVSVVELAEECVIT